MKSFVKYYITMIFHKAISMFFHKNEHVSRSKIEFTPYLKGKNDRGNAININDVNQKEWDEAHQNIGNNCTILAAIAQIAATNPAEIQKMIRVVKPGEEWDVTFAGAKKTVRVTKNNLSL
jgi:hypothetical protein